MRMDQGKGSKYLTFSLGMEQYGIGVLRIKEIIGMMPMTMVPRTPEFVKGVINLRGKIVPVIDLRLRLGMEARAYDGATCIIVVEVEGSAGVVVMGIIVDRVVEVIYIDFDQIEDAPAFGKKHETHYILGLANAGGKVKILLDVDKLINAEEIRLLNDAA
jgi:purine-binding chemotaxis protein CheW